MKHLATAATIAALFLVVIFLASSAIAAESSSDDVIETGRSAWEALSAGKWVLGVGLVLSLVVQLFRSPALGSIVEKIPRRWRVAIPVAFSGLASALLTIAGEVSPETGLMIWPMMAGVAIGTHEVGESLRGRRSSYRASSVLLVLALSGCVSAPPSRSVAAGISITQEGDVMHIEVQRADEGLLSWCQERQERRWWSSAVAQAAGVVAAGLAGSALAHGDDDRVELGLEIGGLVASGLAAGAQAYSSGQAGAHERYCAAPTIGVPPPPPPTEEALP